MNQSKENLVMHKKIYTPLFALFCWLLTLTVRAQDSAAVKRVEMADGFRASGKIYVVIVVLLIILSGLILYVVRLDRKINKLEKDFNK
jgi:heme A synthase